jgi:hypothetical protein
MHCRSYCCFMSSRYRYPTLPCSSLHVSVTSAPSSSHPKIFVVNNLLPLFSFLLNFLSQLLWFSGISFLYAWSVSHRSQHLVVVVIVKCGRINFLSILVGCCRINGVFSKTERSPFSCVYVVGGVESSGGAGCGCRVVVARGLRLLLMHRWNVNISNEEAGCCVMSCSRKCA